MPLHDAWARRTPFELALPSAEFAEEHFGLILEEVEEHGSEAHLHDPRAFALVGHVGAVLQEIRMPDAPAERIAEHALMLFHGFWFWKRGLSLHLVTVDATRAVVEGRAEAGVPAADVGAVYLQLPQHLIWVPGDSGPASLDGVFVTWSEGMLHALAVAGVVRGAEALVVLGLPSVPLNVLAELGEESMRAGGRDFDTSIPGAEVDGLYGVESAGELLKLVAGLAPGLFRGEERKSMSGVQGGPEPSALRYRVLDAPALGVPPET